MIEETYKELSNFEDKLREHCNIEYDITGEEIVKSSVAAVLIAFEEWHKDYLKEKKNK